MSNDSHYIFDGLNDAQKEAVVTTEGPILIVAGPGTGKTLTIVRRLAHLVHRGVSPGRVLAVTFTNRAAREMRERAISLLGKDADKIFIGTFHLLGLKIIKESLTNVFSILDRVEQLEVLKSLMKATTKKAEQVADRISRIKSFLNVPDDDDGSIYEKYRSALKERNAFDFDDLIRVPIELLESSSKAEAYRNKFDHIIVDEYQDINPAQYRLLRLLAGDAGNICAVGDADQAIYAFRGSDISNFIRFEQDFRNSKTFNLSRNYRSTGTIINASNFLIENNSERIEKEVMPSRGTGEPISIVSVPDEKAEGEFVVREIETRIGGTSHLRIARERGGLASSDNSFGFSDFAVIYRTNAQARALEEAFSSAGIPCQVIGRRKGIQTKEMEETLAYLRSLAYPDGIVAPQNSEAHETRLLTSADFYDPRADAVTLTTLHAAKGLEFRIVFIAGFEEGLIPFISGGDDLDAEEERRLFYVGMTRAEDELFLLHARRRFLYGRRTAPSRSPFFGEMPGDYIRITSVPDRMKKQKEEQDQLGLF